ncbi:DUF1692-domain-containing protein [Phellopilus nigrolimitatus]|nr:DUF1692-domain-containing protein [Phellopilus nigrolimitatus]
MSAPSPSPTEESLLDRLDKVAPAALNQFDAFPKLPLSYKARSGERGFLTVLVAVISLLLIANDIGEYIWGWPAYGFGIDHTKKSFMDVNVDLIVNMPCRFLSVDIRDAVGDRLYLSDGFRRDGTLFDIGQAQILQTHTHSLDARQAVAQSRKSRGFFDTIFRRSKDGFRPTYNYKPDGGACRVYGSMEVKKVTANLHITTAGHGYRSIQHVDHGLMNLSHVITDFSFGPYFPDMTQPLKNTLEVTHHPFIAYQYFLSVVPTTYIAPNAKAVHTNQYSVTHYTRVLEHEQGTPGIFFKFDLEPLNMTIHQRTTTFIQFLIRQSINTNPCLPFLVLRVVGVVGGVWCCAGWAFRISAKAIDVVSGADRSPGIVAAEASGAAKRKWGGSAVRSRVARQGSGWVVEGGSPYGSYAGTPVSAGFGSPFPHSPVPSSAPGFAQPGAAGGANGYGLGIGAGPSFAAAQQQQQHRNGGPLPPTPNPASPYSAFPGSPNAGSYFQNHNPLSPSAYGLNSPLPQSPLGPPQRKISGRDEKKVD